MKDDPKRILEIGTYSGLDSIQKLILARDSKMAEFYKIQSQFGTVAAGLSGSILMAGADKVMEAFGPSRRFRMFKFARYFYAMNYAMLLGGIEYTRGVQSSVWEPTKRMEKGQGTVPVSDS